jgi:hypothetical protein
LQIIAALPGYIVGETFQVLIKNSTGWVQTILAGVGVTLPTNVIVPPYTASLYFVTVNSPTAVTLVHRSEAPNNMQNVSFQGSTSGAIVVEAAAVAGSNTATIQAATDTFVMRATTDTLTNKTLTSPTITMPTVSDMINQDTLIMPTAVAAYNTTTLFTPTGMSVALTAGGKYEIDGRLLVTSINGNGLVAELIGTGGLTLTSANIQSLVYNTTAIKATTNVTALSADLVGFANTCTMLDFSGTLVVNAGGTLGLSISQATAITTSTTVAAGSYMKVSRAS